MQVWLRMEIPTPAESTPPFFSVFNLSAFRIAIEKVPAVHSRCANLNRGVFAPFFLTNESPFNSFPFVNSVMCVSPNPEIFIIILSHFAASFHCDANAGGLPSIPSSNRNCRSLVGLFPLLSLPSCCIRLRATRKAHVPQRHVSSLPRSVPQNENATQRDVTSSNASVEINIGVCNALRGHPPHQNSRFSPLLIVRGARELGCLVKVHGWNVKFWFFLDESLDESKGPVISFVQLLC